MAFDSHSNFAVTTIVTPPSPATLGTTIVVSDATGFPTPPFNATLWPASLQPTLANAEIVRVGTITGSSLHIARTQEGSTAGTFLAGDQVANAITAKLFTDLEAAVGGATGSGIGVVTFNQPGVLSTGTGTQPFPFPFAATILGAVASVTTAPTGAAIIVDVNLNGVSIYTTQANRPTIAAGNQTVTTMPVPDVTAVAQFATVTVDIDQIGSTIAGSDLTVNVSYQSA